MQQFDLNHINIFTHVVETRSFSAAAKKLGIPKSKASRAVSSLEQTMNGQLLYRTTRDVTPTELGQNLYNQVVGSVTSLLSGLDATQKEATPLTGTIRITTVEDLGAHILTPVLARFSEKYPKLKFDMIYSSKVIDLVKDGVDVAVRVGPIKQQYLRGRKVGSIKFIFAASPRYLDLHAMGRMSLHRPEILQELDLLTLVQKPTDKSKVEIRNDEKKLMIKIQSKHVSNSTEALLTLAKAGQGVALIPDFMARIGFHEGSLVEVCKGWHLAPMPVSVVTPAKRKLSPLVETFTGFLFEGLKQEFSR